MARLVRQLANRAYAPCAALGVVVLAGAFASQAFKLTYRLDLVDHGVRATLGKGSLSVCYWDLPSMFPWHSPVEGVGEWRCERTPVSRNLWGWWTWEWDGREIATTEYRYQVPIWSTAVPVSLAMLPGIIGARRRFRGAGQCQQCGYLRGAAAVCPECGSSAELLAEDSPEHPAEASAALTSMDMLRTLVLGGTAIVSAAGFGAVFGVMMVPLAASALIGAAGGCMVGVLIAPLFMGVAWRRSAVVTWVMCFGASAVSAVPMAIMGHPPLGVAAAFVGFVCASVGCLLLVRPEIAARPARCPSCGTQATENNVVCLSCGVRTPPPSDRSGISVLRWVVGIVAWLAGPVLSAGAAAWMVSAGG